MPRNKKMPFDNPGTGFVIGFLIPMLIFLGIYYFGDRDITFNTYLSNLWRLHALIKLMSLCVFANLLVFMGFIRIKYDRAARGVLGATIIYGLAILISRAF